MQSNDYFIGFTQFDQALKTVHEKERRSSIKLNPKHDGTRSVKQAEIEKVFQSPIHIKLLKNPRSRFNPQLATHTLFGAIGEDIKTKGEKE